MEDIKTPVKQGRVFIAILLSALSCGGHLWVAYVLHQQPKC